MGASDDLDSIVRTETGRGLGEVEKIDPVLEYAFAARNSIRGSDHGKVPAGQTRGGSGPVRIGGSSKFWEVDLQRRTMFRLLAGGAIGSGRASSALLSKGNDQASQNHNAWVIEVLNKMQTISPGMTREALYQVFTTEGGLSTALQCTFVSRDCPYFKVDVELPGRRPP
jgi:hypothetical protein